MKFAAFVCTSVVLLAACRPQTAPPPPPPTHDPKAMDIIERAQAAPEKIDQAAVDMKQFDLTWIASGQPPFSATEEKRYDTYTKTRQSDGSILLTDRVDGHSEYAADKGLIYTLQRIGGDGHTNVTFLDQESVYSFLTRFPEKISRRALDAEPRKKGPASLRWMASGMKKDAEAADTVKLLQRELTQGVLCDVIEIYAAEAAGGNGRREVDKRMTYYVGATDGLVRRYTESAGPEGRRSYRELLYAVDSGFLSQGISYAWDPLESTCRHASLSIL